MKKVVKLVLIFAVALAGCDQLDDGGGGDGSKVNFQEGYAFMRDRDIYVADKLDFEVAKQLTTSGGNTEPCLSSDGRTVVYVHTDPSTGQTSLRKVATTGGEESDVVPASSDRAFSAPAVRGNKVLFVASMPGQSVLTSVNLDGTGEAAISGSVRDASPTFYADGLYALVLTGPDTLTRNELAKVELSAGVRSSRVSNLSVAFGARAVVSPDGRWIAFEGRKDGHSRIFVVAESGEANTLKQLTQSGGEDTWPTWKSNDVVGYVITLDAGSSIYEKSITTGTLASDTLVVPGAEQGSFGMVL